MILAIAPAMRSVARENPLLQGVIDVTDYNATTAGDPDWRLVGEDTKDLVGNVELAYFSA